MDEKRIAAIFKAFCDENRIRIIKLLRSGEKCACKLLEEINVTQPTLSHHMKILCDAEIVVGRKEGKWTHYSISEKGVEQYNRDLAAWERQVREKQKPAKKEQAKPPERESVLKRLRQLQAEGKQRNQPRQRKKSFDRDSR